MDYLDKKIILFFITICIHISNNVCAEPVRFYKELKLDDQNALVISENVKQEIEVAIRYESNYILRKIIIGNAILSEDDIYTLQLDKSNDDNEIVLVVHDRSSTYGAKTGIIVYKLGWWEFLFIPDDGFDLVDEDKDTIFEIKAFRIQNKTLKLFNGLLIPKNNK